ncbi:MAG TPA: choice-of-anchor R domain-containing protein [Verrucomicrobiae bacterium]|nr:choice-of-anchor R domain-containing protein [Verrucomicrobiae bacterium]
MNMKKITIGVVILIGLSVSRIVQAQGTAYLSNLDQTPSGGLPIGSDSWYAAMFITGTNSSGYMFDSFQAGMADASGSSSNFTAMIYSALTGGGVFPGNNLCTLDASTNPMSAGIYTFTAVSNLMLLPSTTYFVVLTGGTTVAEGAYNWNYVGTYAYSQEGGWRTFANAFNSGNGSFWNSISSTDTQFAINATPIPEPGILGLLGLSGLAFLWRRWKL